MPAAASATRPRTRRTSATNVGESLRGRPADIAQRGPTSQPFALLDVFETNLGWVAVSALDCRLLGVTFGHARRADALAAAGSHRMIGISPKVAGVDATDGMHDWLADLRERFASFARGEFEDFRDVAVDDSHLTPFERSVVRACRAIPYGETMSYGQLAAKVGRSGAARAVGRVMATNRYPLVVPCHRVLASGGGLGGYSAPQGLAMKRRLLAMEADDARASLFPK